MLGNGRKASARAARETVVERADESIVRALETLWRTRICEAEERRARRQGWRGIGTNRLIPDLVVTPVRAGRFELTGSGGVAVAAE